MLIVVGNYFGAGKEMTDTYVITKTKVEMLLIPRFQLMRMTGQLFAPDEEKHIAVHPSRDCFKAFKQGSKPPSDSTKFPPKMLFFLLCCFMKI